MWSAPERHGAPASGRLKVLIMSIGYTSNRDLFLMKQADWKSCAPKSSDTINAGLRFSYGSREGVLFAGRVGRLEAMRSVRSVLGGVGGRF